MTHLSSVVHCTRCTLSPSLPDHVLSTQLSGSQRTKVLVAVPVALHCHRGELGEAAPNRELVEQQHQLLRLVEQSIILNSVSPRLI